MKYKFQCINTNCEKFEEEFEAKLSMADVGNVATYPRCECCEQLTEKVFLATGNFALKGMNWFKNGGYGGGVDVSGRPTGNLVPLGTALKSSTAKK